MTPPPVDEYQQVIADEARGLTPVRRIAENTEKYAEVCREVGAQFGVPVVDIWKSFLRYAGWIEGQEYLPGSRKIPARKSFQSLFTDGDYALRYAISACSASNEEHRTRLTSALRSPLDFLWV